MSQTNPLKEAKEEVKSNEEPITAYIDPSDLRRQEVDSWEEADRELLREELAESLGEGWTYGVNHPYSDLVRDTAVRTYVEELPRVKFEYLVFDSREKAILEGYWPNDMSREEAIEIAHEYATDLPGFHQHESDVLMEIESAILEARMEF